MRRILAALAVLTWAEPALSTDPLLTNTSGKTLIRRLGPGNDLSMVVISRAGTSVFLDPRRTKAVPDLVAITHGHHVDRDYRPLLQGARVVNQQPGAVTVKDVKLTGIAGSHSAAPEIKSPPEYVLYLLEVDGLRIAFLPCTSPKAFTPEQRAALGTVDVAMISAETEQDGRSAKQTYELARSVHARIILTLTHHVGDYEFALDQMADEGARVEHLADPLTLDAASLEGAPERVINLLATPVG
jgi:hypothetical protein